MKQVLANLLENAARHSPDGAPVEVRATVAGGAVELAVADHGPACPSAERERVFQMFNRVSGGGRAGLGLAIAKPSWRPTARPSGWRTPRAAGPASSSPCRRPSSRPTPARRRVTRLARILLIDDDPSLLRALRDRAQRPGLRRGRGPHRRGGGDPGLLDRRPTWSCSTSGCPTSTGWRCAGGSASGAQVPIIVLSAAGDRGPQGRRPRRRGRRLRDQAVRHGRARGPAAGGPAPTPGPPPDEPTELTVGPHRGRPGPPHGPARRRSRSTSPAGSSTCWPFWPATPARSAPTR